MRPRTFLHVEGLPSGDVPPTKGLPSGASMVAEMGAFSGISTRRPLVVLDPTRIREFPFPQQSTSLADLLNVPNFTPTCFQVKNNIRQKVRKFCTIFNCIKLQ